MYNRNFIAENDNEIIQFNLSNQTFLYILLMEIRGKSIALSTFKGKICVKRKISRTGNNILLAKLVRTGLTRLG